MKWLCAEIKQSVESSSTFGFNGNIAMKNNDHNDDNINNSNDHNNNDNNNSKYNLQVKIPSIKSYNYFAFHNNHNKSQNGLHIPIQYLPFGTPKGGKELPCIVRVCSNQKQKKGQNPKVQLMGSDGIFYFFSLAGVSKVEKIEIDAQVRFFFFFAILRTLFTNFCLRKIQNFKIGEISNIWI